MTTPRVLIYDIETSPIIGYTWGIYQQDVIKVLEDWQILTVAWKWLGEKKVFCIGQDDLPGYEPGVNNDKEIVKRIRALFDEADIIIAHNGDSFDQKKCQARMITHGLKPPSPYKQLDTKKLFRKYGAFTSNRLGALASQLGAHLKGDPGGIETWHGCLKGDPKAWARMKRYNRHDIPPLEDLYKTIRPWVNNHPAMNLDTPNACPKCGGGPLRPRGWAPTKTGKRQRYSCDSCGGWCQDRVLVKSHNIFVN